MGCAFSQEIKDQCKGDGSRRDRLSTIDCRRLSTKVVDMIVENVQIISQTLTKEQVQFCVKCLSNHTLFSGLTTDELITLCNEMIWVQGKADEYLFVQGQAGHSFFIIEKGEITVEVDGNKVTELRQGQSFGELALLFRASRAASIKCKGLDNRFFVMKPGLYKSILRHLKETEYSRNKEIIEKISLFNCLTNKQKYTLSNSIKEAYFKSGEVIFQTGDLSNGLYLISEGLVEIDIPGKAPILLKELEVFGQSALKNNSRRLGKAISKQDTKCLVIGKKDIERALGVSSKNLVYFNTQKWALLRSSYFKEFSNAELSKIILGFQCIQVQDKARLPGSTYRGLVISLEGGINDQPQGTLFNVQNWVENQWNCNNLTKNGSGCIGFLSFEKLTEIIEILESRKKLMKASQKYIGEREDNLSNLTIDDFQVVKKLGQGQFGQVFLVKNVKTAGGLFAVKCLNKKAIKKEDMELSVIEEKKILQKAIFPYIVGFVKAFHDKENIFLLMQYIRGKEMFEVIRQMPTLNKPIARYYFGCLLLAIEYLHANNIIYRDIKPENSVIDSHGKAYLIDMGTAKELGPANMFKTFTIIGTPHYMAPEVFEGKGYSFEADYWSLGVLLYQFICGRLPFGQHVHNDPYTLYSMIKKDKVQFPKFVTDEKVKRLINFILVKDPKTRSSQVTFDSIKKHEYFNDFSWTDLLQERILPPYIPRDFRSGKTELNDTTGQKFIRHLYGSKNFGTVNNWDEKLGI